nr:unnamed protein product [Timema californicum]
MKPKLLEANGHTLVSELNQSIVEPNVLGTTERQTLFKELKVNLELLKTNDEIKVQQFKLKKELIVVLEKLSPDILSQISTNSYYKEELISKPLTKLKCSIEALLNELEDSIVIAELDEDAHIPSEILIPVGQLEILSSEAAESKMNNATSSIQSTHLVKLLKILEKNIQNGMSVSLVSNHDDEDESELFLEMALERIMRAVYASLIGFHIMTSSNMPKIIYLEDFIEKVIQFTQYQLKNSVFPSFDPQCRTISKDKVNGKSKKHKTNAKELRISHERRLMYKKMAELITLLAELITVQVITDNSLLHASSIGVAIFFVNNIEQIQLSSLKLVTTIFMKHENHQRLILDDILSSLVVSVRDQAVAKGVTGYVLFVPSQAAMKRITLGSTAEDGEIEVRISNHCGSHTCFGDHMIQGVTLAIDQTADDREIEVRILVRNGLCANPNGFGPLTNLPDFSYKDGRTTPLGVGQQARLLKQREFAKTVVKFCKEMDFAVERHNRLQKEEEHNRQRILDSKLKPKGKQWLETGSK